MAISNVTYLGELRTEAVHLKSNNIIITDAPPDNEGKGEAFSPTDLLSTSLACCMFTLMGITASKHEFVFMGGRAEVEKTMATNPRRVSRVDVSFTLRGTYTERQRALIESAAINCPVAKSLNPNIEQVVRFDYEGL